jgi:hypothetical protein
VLCPSFVTGVYENNPQQQWTEGLKQLLLDMKKVKVSGCFLISKNLVQIIFKPYSNTFQTVIKF